MYRFFWRTPGNAAKNIAVRGIEPREELFASLTDRRNPQRRSGFFGDIQKTQLIHGALGAIQTRDPKLRKPVLYSD